MEANELRIGNWVQWNNVNAKITLADFCEEYETSQAFFHKEPILITEEWLVKFGFDSNRCISLRIDTSFDSLQITHNFDVNIYDVSGGFVCLKKINYVHQLQNLYFALSGEELTLTN